MSSVVDRITRPGWPLLGFCAAGAAALWASLPPAEWWPLVWVALIPWLWVALVLARRKHEPAPAQASSPSRKKAQPARTSPTPKKPRWFLRPLGAVWLSGWGFWLAMLYWLLLPHWAGVFGWLALTLYLSLYVWGFVLLSAHLMARWHWPLALAAPVVWAAGCVVRARLFGGFTIASPAYALYAQLPAVQLAELGGQHLVDVWVVFVAAALTQGLWYALAEKRRRAAAVALGGAVAGLVGGWAYGSWRLNRLPPARSEPLQAVLIQSSFDTVFGQSRQRIVQMHQQCLELTVQAVARHPQVQLVLWPETMFHPPLEWLARDPEMVSGRFLDALGRLHALAGPRWMVLGVHGIEHQQVPPPPGSRPRRYNTAVLVSPQGDVVARYHKMKPIIFGEYIPLGDWFPWLYRLAPMDQGLSSGPAPAVFPCGRIALVPNICYESILPHLVRYQVNEAVRQTQGRTPSRPEVLVNLTNSGWFWGSSELKLHLLSHVFRAVETRRPVLVAANTGISAAVDHRGRILLAGPRRRPTFLFVTIHPYAQPTGYLAWGDAWAWACAFVAGVGLAQLVFERLLAKKHRATVDTSKP